MPTKSMRAKPKKGSRAARRSKSSSRQPQDAIALLKADHREVKAMFREFEKVEEDDQKEALAERICIALTIHTQLEDEIFYPAAYEALEEDDLLDEAEVEHASAKELISQIQSSSPTEPLYDAKVKVLGEYVDHHVQEEEKELFPECRDSNMDLKALGEQLRTRKEKLVSG